jgi:hypothetical protein
VRGGLLDEIVKADEPRHVEHAVVHLSALGTPRDGFAEFVEQSVGVGEPARPHLDPRATAEVTAFGVLEQRALESQLHDPESIAQAFDF